jgi:threonylcarbamoyladenosine tRNA methylthiotransferase MtaB
MKSYRITTLGCKVNQYESQQYAKVLRQLGLKPLPGDAPDLWVVNTCSVTGEAGRKSRQHIRRAASDPRTQVVVVGCYATSDAQIVQAVPGVRLTLGHDANALAELKRFVQARLKNHPGGGIRNEFNESVCAAQAGSFVAPNPKISPPKTLAARIDQFDGHQRAFLKIQDGCDAFCTYCIVPHLRRQLKSKPIQAVIAEAKSLIESGHREIVLSGIYLGAYGRRTAQRRSWSSESGDPLADLVEELASLDGLARLRLSSLEPGDLSEPLLQILSSEAVCVPHLHLPLQSGSDAVLARMNRQYRRDDFLSMIERVRAAFRDPAVTTDIIVGFPGENEEDFAQTLEICRATEFCKIHIFPFSPRSGTAASRWQNEFVPSDVVRERLSVLRAVEAEMSENYLKRFIGREVRVLVETPKPHDRRDGMGRGRCDRYFQLRFPDPVRREGRLVSVRIDGIDAEGARGAIVQEEFPLPAAV